LLASAPRTWGAEGTRETLSAAEWQTTKLCFAAYAEWLQSQPDPTAVEAGDQLPHRFICTGGPAQRRLTT
jgi:hypothetical protein